MGGFLRGEVVALPYRFAMLGHVRWPVAGSVNKQLVLCVGHWIQGQPVRQESHCEARLPGHERSVRNRHEQRAVYIILDPVVWRLVCHDFDATLHRLQDDRIGVGMPRATQPVLSSPLKGGVQLRRVFATLKWPHALSLFARRYSARYPDTLVSFA